MIASAGPAMLGLLALVLLCGLFLLAAVGACRFAARRYEEDAGSSEARETTT